jgi:hypothetical protein
VPVTTLSPPDRTTPRPRRNPAWNKPPDTTSSRPDEVRHVRERVIGSTTALAYSSNNGCTITHNAEADYLDDGPEKPIRIWSRTGRRPLLAAGNSNGDIPMLHFNQHHDKPSLRLLVLHDDADREFDYTAGAEQALEQADRDGWTVVSIKNDWETVFAPGAGTARSDPPT